MYNVTILEFFVRAIPEAFLFVFSTYTFSKVSIDKRKYLLSSVFMAISAFVIRSLPIHFGVHTMLALIALIVINVSINKFEVVKATQAVIITFIVELICEGLNFIIIQYVLRININLVFEDVRYKLLYSSPSLLIFGCLVSAIYFILLKRNKLR